MSWWQILVVLSLLAAGTTGVILVDFATRSDGGGLCNGWICFGETKTFHVGIYMALAGLWGLAALLFRVWPDD